MYQLTQSVWDLFPRPLLDCLKSGIFFGLDGFGQLLHGFLRMGLRLLMVLVGVAAVLLALFVVLPGFSKFWHYWLKQVTRELDRPNETWSSRVTYFYGTWVSAGLCVALALAFDFVFFDF